MTAQAVLRHMEIERDTALSDFQRMPTEHDTLAEQLQGLVLSHPTSAPPHRLFKHEHYLAV